MPSLSLSQRESAIEPHGHSCQGLWLTPYTSPLLSSPSLLHIINTCAHKGERLGGLHSSKVVLYSLDLDEYATFAAKGDFLALRRLVTAAAASLKAAGAEFLVICSNTAHMAISDIERSVPGLPVLHIADCCAVYIKVGLCDLFFFIHSHLLVLLCDITVNSISTNNEETRQTDRHCGIPGHKVYHGA